MSAAQTINHVELVSLDICKFVKPHFIGEILDMEAKVIYVDVKKGLAYV
jgi:acyl-CoA hydrolase